MSAFAEKIRNLPSLPGVYLFKGARGEVLYVGKAKSLSQRVRNYLSSDLPDPRIRELMAHAADLDSIATGSEVEALLLEASLIRQHRPHFNILLKDDKSFPYVRLSVQEEFPRLSITRQVRNDGARYLGPYTDVKRLRRTLREIRRVFPVRTCRNFEDYQRTNRPCLYFHIRRCTGPCTTRSRVNPAEYRALVDGLLLFLTGRNAELLDRLRADMGAAAERLEFERAARLRDQIALLESARVPQSMVMRGGRDTDVIGLARHSGRAAVATLVVRGGRVVGKETRILERTGDLDDGALLQSLLTQHYLHQTDVPKRIVTAVPPAEAELTRAALEQRAGHTVELLVPQRGRARKLLATAERNAALVLEDMAARGQGRRARFTPEIVDLQRSLGLTVPPRRMIGVDISNLGADHAVAAIVASEDGRPKRSLYRRMRIRRPGPDDFAMIGEAVERYWARVESDELPRPDLVMIDGGIGQLHAARAALRRASTTTVAAIGLAKQDEEIVLESGRVIRLPRRSPGLRVLQRLRDEAHRFGLAYHRLLRGRARVASAIDAVPGVGPARRAAMLKAFGSVAMLKQATIEDIVRLARVPVAVAERVHQVLGVEASMSAEPPGVSTHEDDAAGDPPVRRAAGGERS